MAFLTDGFPTTVSFQLFPAAVFKEKTVTPPGVDGGGENDTTTMRNTAWRTKQPKKLLTLTEMTTTVAYDPALYPQIVNSLVNQNGVINVVFSDGSLLEFWGFLDKFKPNAIKEGEQPTADITIIPTNQDNDNVEQPPVFTAP